jgi:outer membrane protein OmpA-like peptidoglycan-associated protein
MKKKEHSIGLCSIGKFFGIFRITLILIFLAGCASKMASQAPEVTRSIQIAQLSQQLEASGAKVIQTGQQVRIIFLSDSLFNAQSANLTSSHPKTLDTLAELMKQLETTFVQISAHTDAKSKQFQNKALSTAQAQTVADYLWSQGLDARIFYSVGYGATDDVSKGFPGNSSQRLNRRVEVDFQYLPLLSSLP